MYEACSTKLSKIGSFLISNIQHGSKARIRFHVSVDVVDFDILQAQFQFTMNSQRALKCKQNFGSSGETHQVFRLVVEL